MTKRQAKVTRAILDTLATVPEGYLLPDESLRADAARMMTPPPTTAELDEAIRSADRARLITGITTDTGTRWKASAVGHAWLAENA
jgi:hypothetical protein